MGSGLSYSSMGLRNSSLTRTLPSVPSSPRFEFTLRDFLRPSGISVCLDGFTELMSLQ